MAEKRLNTRIVHKHETEANWLLATNFIPMKGEIIVYDKDSTHNYERIKIGDGSTLVSSLPFVDDTLRNELIEQINVVDDKVDAVSILVGDTKVSDQIATAIAEKADKTEVPQVVKATSSNGTAYLATVPGIVSLTAGVSFIMIPSMVSKSTTPTLNVNDLGAKPIRRRLSNISASLQAGYAANWLTVNKPFRLMYDGTAWIVEGQDKPSALDLYGAVAEAQKATNDSADQNISNTYIKGLSVSAQEITYTKGDGTTGTVSLSALIQGLLPKVTTVSLPAASWLGESSPYYQDITSSYVTESSKVDIQPSAEQLVEWQNNGLAFNTLSSNGLFRVYVSDFKPTTDMLIQVTIQEVLEV